MSEHIRAALHAPGRVVTPYPIVRNLRQIGRAFRSGRQARARALACACGWE